MRYSKYNRTFVIYVLKDPRDLTWRYIGKSCSGDYRLSGHLNKKNLSKKSHKNNWIKTLLNLGLEPIFEVIEIWTSDLENKIAEREWIAECRRIGVDLTSEGDGGEGACGVIRSKETREKMSRARKGIKTGRPSKSFLGRHHTDEAKAKISIANKGKKPTLGMKHSVITKKRMSETRSGSGNAMFGKTHSAETRKLISDSQSGPKHKNYGKPLPNKTRINISKSKGGRPIIDNLGNITYSHKEASALSGVSKTSVFRVLSGQVTEVNGWSFKYIIDTEIKDRDFER